MIVQLSADVFAASSVDKLDLAALMWLCRGDPHALLLDPPFDPEAPPRGLDAFGELQQEIEPILEYGPEAAAMRPTSCARIRVQATGPSSFQGPVPSLTVFDATSLLSRPLDILVENRRNDGAFLRKMIPPDRRRDFERYVRDGFLRIDSEGGLGEMETRVKSLAGSPEEAARIGMVFDRDCRGQDVTDPLKPSDAAQRLANRCAAVREPWPLAHHMLERRAIENYLPLATLFGWAATDRERRDRAEAFKDLSSDQKRCFPMKKGLLGDVYPGEERERLERTGDLLEDRHLTPLFWSLDQDRRRRLRRGFSKDIAELFQDKDGVARVYEADIDIQERLAIVRLIDERV